MTKEQLAAELLSSPIFSLLQVIDFDRLGNVLTGSLSIEEEQATRHVIERSLDHELSAFEVFEEMRAQHEAAQ